MKNALLLCLLLPVFTTAQPYIKAKTRHRFAQLNLGVDFCHFSGAGTQTYYYDKTGNLDKDVLGSKNELRFIIGGTHFWGHADFFVAFKLLQATDQPFGSSVETGGKYFPWRIEHGKLRPYIGVSWLPVSFSQNRTFAPQDEKRGPVQIRNQYPLTAGIVFNYKAHMIDIGAAYMYDNKSSYYIDRTTLAPVTMPAFRLSIGYKLMLETTASAERGWQSGRTKAITDTLEARKKLNGFTLAAGFSSAAVLSSSLHTRAIAPFTEDYKLSAAFPEFGLGYYLHKPDIQINIAYRTVKGYLHAYGFDQNYRRRSLALEAYKFFADYHGFAPFAGPALSYETLEVNEKDLTLPWKHNDWQGLKPGITAGWDIRPNRLQSWYLRTNIRWFPNLDVKMYSGKNVSLDQLEINFIQLVVFPGRLF